MIENIKDENKDLVFVYTICPTKEEAISIGLSVLNKKLAISIDFWPVESVYPWKGVIQHINQYILMISTQKVLSDKLIESIESVHSYSVPMIAVCESSKVNYSYQLWMDELLSSKERYLSQEEARTKQKKKEENYGKLK
jgi:periplasmic divalent cation tolerance protein